MSGTVDVSSAPLRDWLARTAGFLAFWLVLYGFDIAALPIGALAAILATWASLRLLPAGQWSFHPVALTQLVLRFFYQSVSAGIDVARRALDPRLPLRPGFVIYRTQLPPGPMRNAFCTMTSLLPGTLPSGIDENDGLVIHCLDITQPVAEQLATEEALLVQALGWMHGND